MNRRNFFSMAALTIGAVLTGRANPMPTPTPTPTPTPARSMLDLPPLTPQEKFQGAMLASHSHSISDPGHRHSIMDFEPLDLGQMRPNPDWIPCKGQTVFINGVGVFEVVEDGRGLRRAKPPTDGRRWYRDGGTWQLL